MSTRSVLIAGGGTGGHVYPALAIGDALSTLGLAPVFVGTDRGLESRLVPEHGYPLETIPVRGIRGRGLRGLVSMMKLPLAAWASLRILQRHRPTAVVGVGGYASGPMVAVAALLGYPTLIEEQNVVPGTTNQLLSRWVDDVALPSEDARPAFGGKGFVSGVPVRASLFEKKKSPAGTGSGSWSSGAVRGRRC